ncbi:FixH family protein [Persephonella sp.]
MKKVAVLLFLIVGIAFTSCSKKEAYKKELTEGDLKVVITSDQPPHVGINQWKIVVYKDGKQINDATVRVNGYMPPMPGMPEMSFDYPVENKGGYYLSQVNLSMGGTWQITIFVEKDGKTTQLKFGFNL